MQLNDVDLYASKFLEFIPCLFVVAAISGPVHFQNGDRIPLYWIWDFSHKDGFPRIAAIANTGRKTNVSIVNKI